MLMLRIKLMRALLPMPLDDERRAGRMPSGAPQPEATVLPSLRARHLTLSEHDKQALVDLKSQIRRTGAAVYASYPCKFAGLSSSSSISRGHRGVTNVMIDGFDDLAQRIRADLLENIAGLGLLYLSASRPFDRISLERDHAAGYLKSLTQVCVGRDSQLQRLLDICTAQPCVEEEQQQHSATLVIGPTGDSDTLRIHTN